MNATPHDPRPRIHVTWTAGSDLLDAMQMAIGELFHALKEYPAEQPLDFDTVRLKLDGDPVAVHVTARVGYPLCSECHQPGDRPHTDYCRTRCTCPPEQLILGHAARCPVRAADPWALPAGGVCACGRDYDQAPTPACTTPDHHDTRLPTPSGLTLDEWAAKHGNQHASPEPTPLHQCTDPTCPVTNPHAHAGNDLFELHLAGDSTAEWVKLDDQKLHAHDYPTGYRVLDDQSHRWRSNGQLWCQLPDLPPPNTPTPPA